MNQTADSWIDPLRRTLASYDEPLLRQVAHKLCKPRSQWPVEELLDRCLATLGNPAAVDRRFKDLAPAERQLLSIVAHSRQTDWSVGSLIEILATLGHADGLASVSSLLEAGLLFPRLFRAGESNGQPLGGKNRLKQFEAWMSLAAPPLVFLPGPIISRAIALPLEFPACPSAISLPNAPAREADGLEFPLRLAILWQQVLASPLRRTQQRDFFKRDLDRLNADGLLGESPSDALEPLPDPALGAVALALASGVLVERDGEIKADAFPGAWMNGLPALIAELWQAWPRLEDWNPQNGWRVGGPPGNPWPSAALLALLLLHSLGEHEWARPEDVESWIVERHPFWAEQAIELDKPRGRRSQDTPEARGLARFLRGVAYPLRLVQAAKGPGGEWLVRLSTMGRWVLGLHDSPPAAVQFPQTLLVQPNLEILAYRQGLTPELVVRLTRCAAWKKVGPACTLQLEAASVYRALETGETLESIVQLLQRHGMKPLPVPVLDSLKTWSNKRERISIYPSAALFEFPGPAELADALARGLPAMQLTERLALVPNEGSIDYRHFRLIGTRDYGLPPEQCIDLGNDGVTLNVDLGRSDLLLETEIQGLAEAAPGTPPQGRRVYRLTPGSLAAARNAGWTLANLEMWFHQRTGLPLSPAARLLYFQMETPAVVVRKLLVVQVESEGIADGLRQWPATARLLRERLGPTALVVAEEDVDELRTRCRELGVELRA